MKSSSRASFCAVSVHLRKLYDNDAAKGVLCVHENPSLMPRIWGRNEVLPDDWVDEGNASVLAKLCVRLVSDY